MPCCALQISQWAEWEKRARAQTRTLTVEAKWLYHFLGSNPVSNALYTLAGQFTVRLLLPVAAAAPPLLFLLLLQPPLLLLLLLLLLLRC